MKTVILNWKEGENDPFTEVNRSLAHMFRSCGKNVRTLQLTDSSWAEQLGEIALEGIDFVYTWQGLGSNIVLADNGDSIWELLKVPLICVHGDHPAHMPANHTFESRYCFHLYTNADFASYSNQHFRRKRSAYVIDIPQVFFEQPASIEGEAVFHIVKNIRHTDEFEAEWVKTLPEFALKAYLQAAETLKNQIISKPYVEVHEVLDELIAAEAWDWFSEQQNPGLAHRFHSSLDHYVRNFKAMLLLDELRDVPLKIYGRGWQRFKENAPEHWQFFQGMDMADSQNLYYSRYGIIDVSPSKRLHDRTRRAIANGRPFLSSANLEDSLQSAQAHQDLFYDFRPGQLRGKCESVMSNPGAHLERAREFAQLYHETFHFQNFVSRLDALAMSVDRFQ
jgi:hypothetical protein